MIGKTHEITSGELIFGRYQPFGTTVRGQARPRRPNTFTVCTCTTPFQHIEAVKKGVKSKTNCGSMECKVSEKMSSSESVIFFANLANIPHIRQNNSTLFQIFGKSFGKIPTLAQWNMDR